MSWAHPSHYRHSGASSTHNAASPLPVRAVVFTYRNKRFTQRANPSKRTNPFSQNRKCGAGPEADPQRKSDGEFRGTLGRAPVPIGYPMRSAYIVRGRPCPRPLPCFNPRRPHEEHLQRESDSLHLCLLVLISHPHLLTAVPG